MKVKILDLMELYYLLINKNKPSFQRPLYNFTKNSLALIIGIKNINKNMNNLLAYLNDYIKL